MRTRALLVLAVLAAGLITVGIGLRRRSAGSLGGGPATNASSEQAGSTVLGELPVESGQPAKAEAAPVLPAEGEDGRTTAPQNFLAGLALLPEGTPADERALVIALNAPLDADHLYDGGPADRAFEAEPRLVGYLLALTEVEPDGHFELALPESTSVVHLALVGRYLHAQRTTRVVLPAAEPPRLSAELGAWITGRLFPPVEPSAEAPSIAGIEIEVGPDITGGIDTMAIIDSTDYATESAADGSFELRGVSPRFGYGLVVRPEELAAHVQTGIELEPGEHLELAVGLRRGATLAGLVVDEAGLPVDDARVEARLRGILGDVVRELRGERTEADGTFELSGVMPGRLEIGASLSGYQDAQLVLEQELRDGELRAGLELVLARGLSVAGRVVFPDGTPAADARVRAEPDLGGLGGIGAGLDGLKIARAGRPRTRTDAEGRFELSGMTDVAYRVRASWSEDAEEGGEHSGRWSAAEGEIRPAEADAGGDEIELTLAALAALAGQVSDEAGAPIEEFTVRAERVGSGGIFGIGAERRDWTFADAADGRFEAEGLSAAEWDVAVDAPGFGRSEAQRVRLPDPEDPAHPRELEFVLGPAAAVAGLVLDPAGQPVGGAQVSVELDMGQRMERLQDGGIPSASTDPEGRFLLDDLDPGSHAFVARADGFASSEPLARAVAAGELAEDLVLRLRLGGTLAGEVLGPDGEPATNRMVIVQRSPDFVRQHMLQTGADGTFRIEHLDPGTWQVVATLNFFEEELGAGDDGASIGDLLGSMEMEVAQIVEGEETWVVLGSPPADPVAVSGRVRAADDPVADAFVTFLPEGQQGMSGFETAMTDAEGAYAVELSGAGPHLVTVQAGLGGPGQQQSIEFVDHVPEGVSEHTLDLDLPLGRISGRVHGPDGRPLPGCRVTLNVEGGVTCGSFLGGQYAEVATDEDGAYELSFLRPGTYAVAAGGSLLGGFLGEGEVAGGREVRAGVAVDEGRWIAGVDFRLRAPGTLTGLVTGASGAPASGAAVFVRDESGHLLERFSLSTTGPDGRFRMPGLAPGRYTARALLEGRTCAETGPVTVPEGGEGEIALELTSGTVLRVVVLDRRDERLRATVSVTDAAGRDVSAMRSMAEVLEAMRQDFKSREQRFGPLPPGDYEVTARLDDGRTQTRTLALGSRAERLLKMRFK